MGFHKRHIDIDNVIAYHDRDGIDGLKQLFSADAYIIHGNVDTDKIVKYLIDEDEKSLGKLVSEMKDYKLREIKDD